MRPKTYLFLRFSPWYGIFRPLRFKTSKQARKPQGRTRLPILTRYCKGQPANPARMDFLSKKENGRLVRKGRVGNC